VWDKLGNLESILRILERDFRKLTSLTYPYLYLSLLVLLFFKYPARNNQSDILIREEKIK